VERDISFATLDGSNIGPVQAASLCQRFL